MRLSRTVTIHMRRRWLTSGDELWAILEQSRDSEKLAPLLALQHHRLGRVAEVVFVALCFLVEVVVACIPRRLRGRHGGGPFVMYRWLLWQLTVGDVEESGPMIIVIPPPPGPYEPGQTITTEQLAELANAPPPYRKKD